MAGKNDCVIRGNVGKDAEIRYTPNGVAVASFNVAVNKVWRDSQTNEKREKTSWVKVVAWRGLAETVGKYVKKGMLIEASGEGSAEAYIDQQGKAQAVFVVTANNVDFLSRVDGQQNSQSNTGGEPDNSTPPANDDIPF